MPQVSVVVLNWNGRPYLDACLTPLLAQEFRDFEVVLIDNGSTDSSAEFVAERFPSVRLIRSERNLGFAAGNNLAIQATTSAFVATLNNDTRVEPGWLSALVAASESDPRVGSCASKMLFAAQPEIIDSAGIAPDVAGIAWNRQAGERDTPTLAFPRKRGREERGWVEVFGASAGAALYRRAMLDEIGLFDEDFFAYLEDIDLAWRARLAGWRCLYVPEARVYHVHSATVGMRSAFKGYHLGRNKLWTIVKNYPMPELALYAPVIGLYDLLAVAYHLLVRRDLSPLRGRLAAVGGLQRMLAKRRAIQKKRMRSFAELRPLMILLRNPIEALTSSRMSMPLKTEVT
jgi:GT2 family glycosyltransferase